MSSPIERNRLDEAASPYLRQHAENPVNWQPWDETALEAARELNRPLFVSIGYSSCHWCHVMAEESFADESVATVLNEHFVPIKIDREERPDLDSVYMTVCQLVTGGGGWPLSAWCTPEGDPFYVGTYFPKEPVADRPGFEQLCTDIANSWADPEQREEMHNRADQWKRAARDQLESVPDQPDRGSDAGADADDVIDGDRLGEAAAAAIRAYDEGHGGFGRDGPKFPMPGRIDVLLRSFARTGREAAREAATGTLDAMATGGMYDHAGGGFHRYAVDRDWTVPHFEKMLYDNAELPRVYLDAYQVTGDPAYAVTAQETFAFVRRELTHGSGAFFSTLDARSVPPESRERGTDPEEGAFYVWTPEEIDDIATNDGSLDPDDAKLVKDRFGIRSGGNFEGGTTVLNVVESVAELAADRDASTREIHERLMDARAALFDARSERPRPNRDEKVLAGWNGRMISAFAAGQRVLGDPYGEFATSALASVRDRLYDEGTNTLHRRWIDGDVGGPGYLEDYAFLARGAFDTYQVTGEVEWLGFALDLADGIVEEFYDPDAETIYFTAADDDPPVARPQEFTDRSTPSSLGVAVDLLYDLDGFHPDREYRSIAESVLATHTDRVRSSPLEHVSLAMAVSKVARGGIELTIAAEELPAEWTSTLAGRYLPGAIVAPRPPTDTGLDEWLSQLGLERAPPIWADRDAAGGTPTVYACEGRTCSPPQTDLRSALDWLEDRG